MPDEAVPRVVERHRALDRPVGDVDDGERRLREAVVGDDEVAAVRRLDDVERQIADHQMAAGRRQPPAVRQQRRAVRESAGRGGLGRRRLSAGQQRRSPDDREQNGAHKRGFAQETVRHSRRLRPSQEEAKSLVVGKTTNKRTISTRSLQFCYAYAITRPSFDYKKR